MFISDSPKSHYKTFMVSDTTEVIEEHVLAQSR